MDECLPYLEYRSKQIIVQDALLKFFGIDISNLEKKDTKHYNFNDIDKQKVIGRYCKGKYVEQCKKQFGDGLWLVCSTCPE